MADEVQNNQDAITVTTSDTNTTTTTPPVNKGSTVFGISVRSLIALLFVVAYCASIFLKVTPPSDFTSLVGIVVAFYFGHTVGQASNGKSV